MSFRLKIKRLYETWLKNLAASNKDEFKDSTPDCCKLLNHKKGGS